MVQFELYAQKILLVLGNRNIPCLYNRDEDTVYSSSGFEGDTLYGVYGYSGGGLRHYCIYGRRLPAGKIEQAGRGLEQLNNGQAEAPGYFFINRSAGCIAFTCVYPIPAVTGEDSLEGFDTFCLASYRAFKRNRKALSAFISGSNEKIIKGWDRV